jgi:hypothetical protein
MAGPADPVDCVSDLAAVSPQLAKQTEAAVANKMVSNFIK